MLDKQNKQKKTCNNYFEESPWVFVAFLKYSQAQSMLLCLRVFLSLRNISYGKLKKLRGKRYHHSATVVTF